MTPDVVQIDLRWLLPAQAAIAMTWLGILEVFGPLGFWGCISLVGAAASIFVATRAPAESPARAGRFWISLQGGVLLAASWLIPYPSNFPLLLIALAAILLGCAAARDGVRRVGLAVGILGVTAASQGIAAWCLRFIWLRLRLLPAFGQITAAIFDWAGTPSGYHGGMLSINTDEQLLRIAPSFENLGMLPLGMFLAGALPALLLLRDRASLLRVTLATAAYLLWRFLVLCAIYVQFKAADIFWDPVATLLGLLIYAALLLRLLPTPSLTMNIPLTAREPLSGGRPGRAIAAIGVVGMLALGCSIGWAIGYEDPGIRKGGRVIIDESHSDWEWTQRDYDTEWYGERSGYNYATLFQHLGRYYRMGRHEKGAIDRGVLDACDVLVLKTPTRPYAPAEVDAIIAFVDRGGGLYLIGDHTNVFGMTTYLNRIAEKFGFVYEYDATYELSKGSLQQYLPPSLLRHPIAVNMPKQFLFGTSCSLRPGWSSRVPLCGYNLRALYLDYSRQSFFPEGHLEPSMSYGWVAQGVVASRGRGRVAAFTDSTVFSNFWYFMPGKNELFMGIVEWLNRSNTPQPINAWPFAVVCFIGSLVILAVGIRSMGGIDRSTSLLVGLVAGLAAVDRFNHAAYLPPTPHDPATFVSFDRDYSDLNIPAFELPGAPRSFHTFYTWVQRLGLVPVAPEDAFDHLDRSKILFMIYPNKRPPRRKLDVLDRWLKAGGTLVVLDGYGNLSPTANDWLARYDLRFDYGSAIVGDVEDLTNRRWATTSGMKTIGGDVVLNSVDRITASNYRTHYIDKLLRIAVGMAVRPSNLPSPELIADIRSLALAPPRLASLTSVRRVPIATTARVGNGRIILMGLADSFQDAAMGTTRGTPTSREKSLFQLEYALLRGVTQSSGKDRLPFP